MPVQRLVAVAEAAGQGEHRHAVAAGEGGDAQRRLAVQGLAVETALAGDRQVGADQRGLQTGDFGDQLDAGAKARRQEALRGEAHAAGRTAARLVARVAAQRRRAAVGEVGEGSVELRHLRGVGAFLRAEHRRGAVRSAQRVVDVAGDLDGHPGEARVEAAGVDARQLRQRRTARRQRAAGGVFQVHAEGAQHAAAGVVGGAAAEAEDDAHGAGVQRGADQLAGAVAAGAQHVALGRRHPLQAAGRGHLDQRAALAGQPAPVRQQRRAERAAHPALALLAAGGREQRRHGAFAAVGHRPAQQLGLRPHLAQAGGDDGGDFGSAEAFLERIWGDDDFHGRVSGTGMPGIVPEPHARRESPTVRPESVRSVAILQGKA